MEIDFELYRPDALLKLSAEYPKLERFVLSKLRQLDRNNLYDDFDDKTAGKIYLSNPYNLLGGNIWIFLLWNYLPLHSIIFIIFF